MRQLLSRILIVVVTFALFANSFAVGDELKFEAAEILPKAVLQGPNYQVEPNVQVSGSRFVFLIRTRWGTLPAEGLGMLELRLREMYAIERARRLSTDPQLISSALSTLQKTPDGVRILLTDPRGALARVPKGVIQTVSNVTNRQNRKAGTESRRKFAAEIGCDPETSNPVLKRLLDEMAVRRGLGVVAAKAGLSLALPGLSLLPTTAEIKETVAKKLPSEINKSIARELTAMGISRETADEFCFQSIYTTTQRLQFLQAVISVQEVVGMEALVKRAVSAKSEADAIVTLQEALMLAKLQQSRPIAVISSAGWPIAIQKDGTYVLVCVEDLTLLDKATASRIRDFRRRFPSQKATFLTTGRLGRRAKQALQESSISTRI